MSPRAGGGPLEDEKPKKALPKVTQSREPEGYGRRWVQAHKEGIDDSDLVTRLARAHLTEWGIVRDAPSRETT